MTKNKTNSRLVVIDRDGTVIENSHYLGKDDEWKNKIVFREDIVKLIFELQESADDVCMCIFTNQSGVGLGYFNEERVQHIHTVIDRALRDRGVHIDFWLYSPEIDKAYAISKGIEINKYVKEVSSRKPNPALLIERLAEKGQTLESFDEIVVIGDSEDDQGLATNIGARFIRV